MWNLDTIPDKMFDPPKVFDASWILPPGVEVIVPGGTGGLCQNTAGLHKKAKQNRDIINGSIYRDGGIADVDRRPSCIP
jgi:hypothetical protein